MGRTGKVLLSLSVIIIIVIMILIFYFFNKKVTIISFNESIKNTLNPSRGYFYPIQSYDYKKIKDIRDKGITLVFVKFNIEEYKDIIISKEKLNELDMCFTEARKEGLKIILRVAYGFDRSSREPEDLNLIRQHILQLKPIVEKNGDLLYVVEAGILGPWGEWHNSTHGNPPDLEVRKQIVKIWEEVLPNSVFINLRRPSFVRDMYPDQELNDKIAFSSSGIARTGWHNDALLSTDDDMGTYPEELTRTDELKWSSNHNLYAPFGGETNNPSEYSSAKNAIEEFEDLRISYLNIAYHKDVIDGWRNEIYNEENAWDYINKKLGYRFVLDTVELTEEVKPNHKNYINIKINNTGFAPLYYEYNVNLVVLSPVGIIYRNKIDTDIREWKPNNNIYIEKKIKMPSEISEQEVWKIGIEITDKKITLKENTLYNIQLSNENIKYLNGVNYFVSYEVIDDKFIFIQ